MIDPSDGTLSIVTGLSLDYERTRNYRLQIKASDNDGLSSDTSVQIHVTDANDNPPVFTSDLYFFNVSEVTFSGESIGFCTATDLDSSVNAELHFKIVSGGFGYFTIDAVTGEILLTKKLDCKNICAFYMTITVSDRGRPLELVTNSTLVINVLPTTVPILSKHHYDVSVPHNMSINSQLIALELNSAWYLPYPRTIYFSLSSTGNNNNNKPFSINNFGMLSLISKIPTHLRSIPLQVTTTTDESGCMVDTEVAAINIIVIYSWITDEPPMFLTTPVFYISESQPVGSIVGHVKAATMNRQEKTIRYTIIQSPSPIFILETTGVIRLRHMLDFEIQKEHQFEIQAALYSGSTGRGAPQAITNQTVYIVVEDANDNEPQFLVTMNRTVTVPITQKHPGLEIIARFQAFDLDSGKNGELTYKLENYLDIFGLNPADGLLSIIRNNHDNNRVATLNHGGTFELGITVSDSGKPSLSQSTTVMVTFIEINTPPRFDQHHFKFDIEVNQTPALEIHVFKFEDLDKAAVNRERNNFQIISSIASESIDIEDYFSLETTSGVLKQLKKIDREHNGEFIFQVSLSNGDVEVDKAELIINILDINDSPPNIVKNQHGFIEENLLATITILKVKASDDDLGENSRLRYSIVTRQSEFKIDQETGEIFANQPFDYEERSEYHLQFRVSDSAPPHNKAVGNITIYIQDLNDNPPRFTDDMSLQYKLHHSAPCGTYITSVKATDADSAINSNMRFAILNNNTKAVIDRYTGTITSASNTSADLGSSFTIQVTVFDPTTPDINADRKSLHIKFTNDNFPALMEDSPKFIRIIENDLNYIITPFYQFRMAVNQQLSGGNKHQFVLASSNHGYFRVNKTSGAIYLRKALDYEEKRWHEIWVCVSMVDTPAIRTCSKLVVRVNDTNDNLPSFQVNKIAFKVMENTMNKCLGTVLATDADEGDQIFYHLVERVDLTTTGIRKFNINKTNGVISRIIEFDYERTKTYNFTVVATNDPMFPTTRKIVAVENSILVQVRIIDQNEPPEFTALPTVIQVAEDHPIHQVLFTFKAFDPDSSSEIMFSIKQQTSDPSRILPLMISDSSGELFLVRSLDREEMGTNHSISVSACDGEFTVHHNLTFVIIDVNDSPPSFASPHFIIGFPEKTTVERQIFEFSTTDRDEGLNAISDILFATTDRNIGESISDNFLLHKNGSLVTKTSFRISGEPLEFKFLVTARNREPPFLMSSSNVTIRIGDVNDHIPVFSASSFSKGFLQADAQPGKYLGTVNAIDDQDLGKNTEVEYFIVGGNGSAYFQINSATGKITVKESLLKLKNQKLLLHVKATDSGNTPLSTTCTIKLNIEPINHNSPAVYKRPYTVDIYENHTVDSMVLQIDASDIESGKDLVYQVLDGEDFSQYLWKIFNNGSLVLNSPLDYDKGERRFKIDVKITDSSVSNPKSTSTSVTVNILNINDEPPVFQSTEQQQHQQQLPQQQQQQQHHRYQVSVPENFNISYPILKVYALDSDSAATMVTYKLANTSGNWKFTVDSTSGFIYSQATFDYEQQRSYQVLVEASDNDIPPLKSSTTVTINITGINEHWPRFVSDFFFFDMSRSEQNLGHSVGRARATDADSGRDGECVYKIASPTEYGFKADPSTGDILVSRRSLRKRTNLTILALNRNRQDFFTSAHVQVQVMDFTGAPVFERDHYVVFVREGAVKNKSIAHFSVSHYDADNVFYEMTIRNYKDLPFTLGSKTGDLHVLSPLDYEQKKKYEFQIGAIYQNFPRGYAMVTLNVLDVNDNSPEILELCVGNITENTKPGFTIIPEIIASDADSYSNAGPFRYSLLDNADNFEIDGKTGKLRNRVAFDREMKTGYNISVEVLDNGSPPLSTKLNCFIRINDANDNKATSRNVRIIVTEENSYRNLRIGNLSPIDPDSSSLYKCNLRAGNDNRFKFDLNTCFLRTTSIIDDNLVSLTYYGHDLASTDKPTKCSFTLERRALKDEHLSRGVLVYIHNTTSKSFLELNFEDFEKYTNQKFSSMLDGSSNIFIGSVKNFGNGVILSLLTTNPTLRNQDLLQYHIEDGLREPLLVGILPAGSNLKIFDACNDQSTPSCKNQNTVCQSTVEFGQHYTILDTPKLIFHTRAVDVTTQCRCQPGLVGLGCQISPVRCSDIPCQNSGTCVNTVIGFQCACSEFFNGDFCQLDVNECLQLPCQHGGSCVNKYGGFFCVCDQDHEGDVCETKKSPCSSKPCFNNGTCVISSESDAGFKCDCRFGDWGTKCETRSWNFAPTSYFENPGNYTIVSALDDLSFQISGEFATVQKDFLLVAFVADERMNFTFFIDAIGGKLRVTMATEKRILSIGGDGDVVGKFVSDGVFHSFKLGIDNTVYFNTRF